MKKKLHNSLISFVIFLIFLNFSHVNSAQTNCETFKKDLNILGYSMRPTGLYNTYGFVLKENYNIPENKWEFSKSNGNYQVGKIFDPELIKNITPGDEIISLNGKEFDYELFKNENELLFEFKTTKNENLKKNLKSKQYSIFDPSIDIEFLDFNKIDTKNGVVDFTIKYDIFSYFYPDSNVNLWEVVEKNLLPKKQDGTFTYLICDYDKNEFKETKLNPPEYGFKILNSVNVDKSLINETVYKITPYSKKVGNDRDTLSISAEISGTYRVKNEFNLKTFPFDRQEVNISFVDFFQKIPNTILFESGLSYAALNNIFEKNDIPGWNIKSFNFKDLNYQNPYFMDDDFASGISLSMIIERKHSYYLYKVILPIILILSVCWLVVWIDPKELEARLTVTIVCLLSLIAYNFVIDSELPKLEYLTVLDWIILTSYVYAVIPNILSVISFRLLKTNQILGSKIEKISTQYGVLSYFIIIFLIILFNANLNPDNSTALISWMAGR